MRERKVMKLEHGQWYIDKIFNTIICFDSESNGRFWFYDPMEDHLVVYLKNDLENLERY